MGVRSGPRHRLPNNPTLTTPTSDHAFLGGFTTGPFIPLPADFVARLSDTLLVHFYEPSSQDPFAVVGYSPIPDDPTWLGPNDTNDPWSFWQAGAIRLQGLEVVAVGPLVGLHSAPYSGIGAVAGLSSTRAIVVFPYNTPDEWRDFRDHVGIQAVEAGVHHAGAYIVSVDPDSLAITPHWDPVIWDPMLWHGSTETAESFAFAQPKPSIGVMTPTSAVVGYQWVQRTNASQSPDYHYSGPNDQLPATITNPVLRESRLSNLGIADGPGGANTRVVPIGMHRVTNLDADPHFASSVDLFIIPSSGPYHFTEVNDVRVAGVLERDYPEPARDPTQSDWNRDFPSHWWDEFPTPRFPLAWRVTGQVVTFTGTDELSVRRVGATPDEEMILRLWGEWYRVLPGDVIRWSAKVKHRAGDPAQDVRLRISVLRADGTFYGSVESDPITTTDEAQPLSVFYPVPSTADIVTFGQFPGYFYIDVVAEHVPGQTGIVVQEPRVTAKVEEPRDYAGMVAGQDAAYTHNYMAVLRLDDSRGVFVANRPGVLHDLVAWVFHTSTPDGRPLTGPTQMASPYTGELHVWRLDLDEGALMRVLVPEAPGGQFWGGGRDMKAVTLGADRFAVLHDVALPAEGGEIGEVTNYGERSLMLREFTVTPDDILIPALTQRLATNGGTIGSLIFNFNGNVAVVQNDMDGWNWQRPEDRYPVLLGGSARFGGNIVLADVDDNSAPFDEYGLIEATHFRSSVQNVQLSPTTAWIIAFDVQTPPPQPPPLHLRAQDDPNRGGAWSNSVWHAVGLAATVSFSGDAVQLVRTGATSNFAVTLRLGFTTPPSGHPGTPYVYPTAGAGPVQFAGVIADLSIPAARHVPIIRFFSAGDVQQSMSAGGAIIGNGTFTLNADAPPSAAYLTVEIEQTTFGGPLGSGDGFALHDPTLTITRLQPGPVVIGGWTVLRGGGRTRGQTTVVAQHQFLRSR
jgi:hypothetical protein